MLWWGKAHRKYDQCNRNWAGKLATNPDEHFSLKFWRSGLFQNEFFVSTDRWSAPAAYLCQNTISKYSIQSLLRFKFVQFYLLSKSPFSVLVFYSACTENRCFGSSSTVSQIDDEIMVTRLCLRETVLQETGRLCTFHRFLTWIKILSQKHNDLLQKIWVWNLLLNEKFIFPVIQLSFGQPNVDNFSVDFERFKEYAEENLPPWFRRNFLVLGE